MSIPCVYSTKIQQIFKVCKFIRKRKVKKILEVILQCGEGANVIKRSINKVLAPKMAPFLRWLTSVQCLVSTIERGREI